jgi:hypothetical protein
VSIQGAGRPCVPRAPSLCPHCMPPRITRKSYRPRVSERTMVGTGDHFLLASFRAERRCRGRKMKFLGWQEIRQVASSLRTTSRAHGIKGQDKPSFLRHRGWMPRQKSCGPPAVGKLFLLTSPFREPPLPKVPLSPLPFSSGEIDLGPTGPWFWPQVCSACGRELCHSNCERNPPLLLRADGTTLPRRRGIS